MARPKKEKRITLNVDVPPEAAGRLREYCVKAGRIQRDVLGKLIVRFVTEPPPARTAMIDGVDGGMEIAYAEFLERMASQLREKRGPLTIDHGDRITTSGPQSRR